MPKRLGAAIADGAPILLFWILALGIVQQVGLGASVVVFAALSIFVAYHAAFMYYWAGETPGRRLFDIRIVSTRGAAEPTIAQCVARPAVRIVWLFSFVPFALVHHNPGYGLIPAVVDMFLASALPSRQTLADVFCRTLVVRTPPPEPHRAPAGPMYSRTDAEFGVAPRR